MMNHRIYQLKNKKDPDDIQCYYHRIIAGPFSNTDKDTCEKCREERYEHSDSYLLKLASLWIVGFLAFTHFIAWVSIAIENSHREGRGLSSRVDYEPMAITMWFMITIVAMAVLFLMGVGFVKGVNWYLQDHSNPKKEKKFSEAQIEERVEDEVTKRLKAMAMAELDAVDVTTTDLQDYLDTSQNGFKIVRKVRQ